MSEPTFRTYTELAEEMCAELAPHLDRPYALFGHCGSALAAYEAAVRLQYHCLPAPARVYVSSQFAPQDGPAGFYLTLNDDQLKGELSDITVAMGGTPLPTLIDMHVGILRSDIEVNRRYVVPRPVRVGAPLTAITWSDAHELPPGAMDGWGRCGETTHAVLPGDHHHFLKGGADLLDLLEAGLIDA
jgi:surfactin synthase thioesterase subunit